MKTNNYYQWCKNIYLTLINSKINTTIALYLSLMSNGKNDDKTVSQLAKAEKEYQESFLEAVQLLSAIEDIYAKSLLHNLNLDASLNMNQFSYYKNLISKFGFANTQTRGSINQHLQKQNKIIKNSVDFLLQIITSIESIRKIQFNEYKTIYPDYQVLEILAPNDSFTIKKLSKYFGDWNTIIHGFKRLSYDSSPEDTYVYSVDDGSIILNIGILVKTVNAILMVLERYNTIRLEREKLKQEFLKTSDLVKEVADSVLDEVLKKALESNQYQFNKEIIANELCTEAMQNLSEHEYNELNNAISISIDLLLKKIDDNCKIQLLKESIDSLLEVDSNENTDEIAKMIESNRNIVNQNKEISMLSDEKIYLLK
jgi:hypothetical protein